MKYSSMSDDEIAALLRRNDPSHNDPPLTTDEIEELRQTTLGAFASARRPRTFLAREALFAATATAAVVLALFLSYELGRNSVLEAQLGVGEYGTSRGGDDRLTQLEMAASLLPPLSSSDPYQRKRALLIGQTLGLDSVRRVAESQALTERDLETRLAAESVVLGGPDAADAFQRLSAKRQLRIELWRPDLRQLRLDAEGYARGGAANGAVKAVELFNKVVDALSPTARNALDRAGVSAARLDADRGDTERAALRFMTVLATAAGEDEGISQEPSAPR
jgi:hypothetical protein